MTTISLLEKPWAGLGVGGSLALDFVNTLDWRLREPPVEGLKEFPDLLRWGLSSGVYSRAEARRLLAWSREHPRLAAQVVAEAVEVREAIAAVFEAVANGAPVPPAPLARLDEASRAAWAGRVLKATAAGEVQWAWRDDDSAPHRPAAAAALDATRILTSTIDRERIRQCGDAQCGWMFLDTSRNRSRRWCTMELCGNRNKARSFYQRTRAGAPSR